MQLIKWTFLDIFNLKLYKFFVQICRYMIYCKIITEYKKYVVKVEKQIIKEKDIYSKLYIIKFKMVH